MRSTAARDERKYFIKPCKQVRYKLKNISKNRTSFNGLQIQKDFRTVTSSPMVHGISILYIII